MYESVLAPFIRANKEVIQTFIVKARKATESAASEALKQATDPNNVAKAMKIGLEV